MKSRRTFLTQSTAVTAGFFGLDRFLSGSLQADETFSYGELIEDPGGLVDLPKGFRYRVLSITGDTMKDGYRVPGQPDGMAAFDVGKNRVALIRNHEIGHAHFTKGPFSDNSVIPEKLDKSLVYDAGRHGAQPFVGGTTTIVYNLRKREVENEFLSLIGTDRNCAGGPTPWRSWLTCEEPADMTTKWGQFHGYCFEVPATAKPAITPPLPLKEMGRFRREAVAVDPDTGIVYQTEDRGDGVITRFIPKEPGKLAKGGRLEALSIKAEGNWDTRNWPGNKTSFPIRERLPVEWVDVDEVDSPNDDLRFKAIEKGAVIFSRAEGMWYGSPDTVGESSIYWACTNGGQNQMGQIFRYFPNEDPEKGGELELFLEPNDSELLTHADNITIAPSGELFICEDTKGTNHIRGVTKGGDMFTLARNAFNGSEFAGACFSPDGSTLFANLQSPGITVAISGPFLGDTGS